MSCIPWRLVLAALSPSRQTQHYKPSHKLDRATPDQNHRLIHVSKAVSHEHELPAYQNQFLVHQYQLSTLEEQLPAYQAPRTPHQARQNPLTPKTDPATPVGTVDVETLRHDFLSPLSYSSPFFSQPLTPHSLSPPQPLTRQTPRSYQAREMDVEALMVRLEALAEEQEMGRVLWGG